MTLEKTVRAKLAGLRYIEVVMEQLPITQRDVADYYHVTEVTVRRYYQKFLLKHGLNLGSDKKDLKKLLKKERGY